MTLTTENRFKPNLYGKGVYINLVTITDVEDVSNTILPFINNTVDIGVKLTLDIGREFQPELTIFGNFERDTETNKVIGWGSAFCVQELLFKLCYKGQLNPDNSIPKEALQSLIGKQFFKLAYVSGIKESGQLKYTNWNLIAADDEYPEYLAKRFQKSILSGYPKNYKPELIDIELENFIEEEATSQFIY